jgi:hypothetical protein
VRIIAYIFNFYKTFIKVIYKTYILFHSVFPYAIDIRMNKSNPEDLEDLLDVVDALAIRGPVPIATTALSSSGAGAGPATEDARTATNKTQSYDYAAKSTYNPKAYADGNKEYTVTTWTPHGLRGELVTSSQRRPQSASAKMMSSSDNNGGGRDRFIGTTLPLSGTENGVVGSLLDKHIRKIQQDTTDFHVPIIKVFFSY